MRHYRDLLAESMFLYALNQRFFKIARRKDPPFFSCSTSADVLVNPLKVYMITSSCKEKGTVQALESMLIEVWFSSITRSHLILFSFNLTIVKPNVSGCQGTVTWVFRTGSVYSSSFTDVRD